MMMTIMIRYSGDDDDGDNYDNIQVNTMIRYLGDNYDDNDKILR